MWGAAVDRRRTEDLMAMLGLAELVELLARVNGVGWCGHVLRRDEERVLNRVSRFEVNGPCK